MASSTADTTTETTSSMSACADQITAARNRVAALQAELQRARDNLAMLEQRQSASVDVTEAGPAAEDSADDGCADVVAATQYARHSLTRQQVQRYSRHLLVSSLGVAGQERLCAARVLVVGAGGLGCPAALYLAAAGVGTIGLVDDDVVEESNLQRQVAHKEATIGQSKVDSLATTLLALNSGIAVERYPCRLTPANAQEIISRFRIVLDATDNPASRYLINDAAMACGTPLVSASAVRMDGQLSVFGLDSGPCYRCLFPIPPPAATVCACNDGGVLGAVTGVLGALQAIEAIKIVTGTGTSLSQRMLVYTAATASFRTVRLRPRSAECPACCTDPARRLAVASYDYHAFCSAGAVAPPSVPAARCVTPKVLASMRASDSPPQLVDVRDPIQFAIAAFPDAINIPLGRLQRPDVGNPVDLLPVRPSAETPIVLICRRGIDSAAAAALLSSYPAVLHLVGGYTAWAHDVDPSFPLY